MGNPLNRDKLRGMDFLHYKFSGLSGQEFPIDRRKASVALLNTMTVRFLFIVTTLTSKLQVSPGSESFIDSPFPAYVSRTGIIRLPTIGFASYANKRVRIMQVLLYCIIRIT